MIKIDIRDEGDLHLLCEFIELITIGLGNELRNDIKLEVK